MSDYVNLLGADDVRAAGHNIQNASQNMMSAANSISDSLIRHENFLSNWLFELREILEKEKNDIQSRT